jgi:Fe2+ transport system protein FeoA
MIHLSLVDLTKGQFAEVVALDSGNVSPILTMRLASAGFLQGELVEVLHRGVGSKGNIVARVGGHTNFALRQQEAALIKVSPLGGHLSSTLI